MKHTVLNFPVMQGDSNFLFFPNNWTRMKYLSLYISVQMACVSIFSMASLAFSVDRLGPVSVGVRKHLGPHTKNVTYLL